MPTLCYGVCGHVTDFFLLLRKTGAAAVLIYRVAVMSGLPQTAPDLGELWVFNGVMFTTSPLLSH